MAFTIQQKRDLRRKYVEAGLCSCGRDTRIGFTNCDRCSTAMRDWYKRRYNKVIDIILGRYGKVCCCCGIADLKFLTIDHIHGGGTQHRKEIGVDGGVNFYRYLIEQGLPDGYQTLCFNCNVGKYRNNGICPHKEKKNESN